MNNQSMILASLILLVSGPALADECKAIHADLSEVAATEGCDPGEPSCFLGEVDGNHGLRGVTHFRADSARIGPATSPDFISYSGLFRYTTAGGTIVARETGVTNSGPGVVTAYQRIIEADGEFSGATGYFFVSGHKGGGVITTKVTGEICMP